MNALGQHIRALIKKSGPMPVSRYMELALQHPEHGYYRRGDTLGRTGDFVTAPEVSQMFGELIGLAIAETWKSIGRPDPFTLLELGPGRGTLMHDALRATAKIPDFHDAMVLHLLESNKTFLSMQKEKLHPFRPRYVDDLGLLPDMPTLCIANEFFDALAARQFERTAEGWCERLITVDGEEFAFMLSKPDPALLFLIPPDRREEPVGTVHEISLTGLTLIREIARHIAEQGGAALIIDYGYAAPPATATLQAVSGHRHADVLERPGEVDLTVHVDFGALRHMALSHNTRVLGPVGQGEFLQTLGIDMRAAQLKHHATPEQAKAISDGLYRLIDHAEMGALFKAMAIVGPNAEMPGF